MRYTLTILLFIVSIICRGQYSQRCSIYKFEGNDSTKKWLVSEQTFSKAGKVIKDVSYNLPVANRRSTKAGPSISSISVYNYKDTLLISDFSVQFGEQLMARIDSQYTYYTYDAHNKLTKKVQRQHHVVRARGQGNVDDDPEFTGYEWREPEVTNYSYTYGAKGLLSKYREDTKCCVSDHYYIYDAMGRITTDSSIYEGHPYDLKGKAIPCGSFYKHGEAIEKRVYTAKGYKTHVYSEPREYTMEYDLDDHGRTIRWENVTIRVDDRADGTKNTNTYIYDTEGRLLEEISIQGNTGDATTYRYDRIYLYDQRGQLVKKVESGYSASTTTLYVYY